MNLFKCAVVCVAVFATCGCEQGQPTAPVSTTPAQATPAVPAADFAATKKDAESGDAKAQHNLGVMYENGQGVPQDYAEALKWFRLAADQGHAMAQNNLGYMYCRGKGVRQDKFEAYAWFSVAAAGGYADAVLNRDLVAGEWTPEQLSQGQRRAIELFKKISSGK